MLRSTQNLLAFYKSVRPIQLSHENSLSDHFIENRSLLVQPLAASVCTYRAFFCIIVVLASISMKNRGFVSSLPHTKNNLLGAELLKVRVRNLMVSRKVLVQFLCYNISYNDLKDILPAFQVFIRPNTQNRSVEVIPL